MKKFAFLKHKKDTTLWFTVCNPESVSGVEPEMRARVLDSSDKSWTIEKGNLPPRPDYRYFLLSYWVMTEYDTQEEMVKNHLADIL